MVDNTQPLTQPPSSSSVTKDDETPRTQRGRFSLEPLVVLSHDDAESLRDATLHKDTDCIKPTVTAAPSTSPKVRRIGRFQCELAEPCDLIKRRRVGRFDVVTVPTSCMVSRNEDPSQMARAVLKHVPCN
ncbi:hypothetical protein FOL47_001662 [Perkinsus chesapeaki]|uniref:Uncharacterized protein n=1 Tax=Perkinsus chesapeaki TaxID=330153 RepID=A0A7J6MIG0_PERCH|nr:hypothetical protein FOL47_001662 [Perkinsus chesapeaki]